MFLKLQCFQSFTIESSSRLVLKSLCENLELICSRKLQLVFLCWRNFFGWSY